MTVREHGRRPVMMGVRVSLDERAALEGLAQEHDRTASREIRRAIRFYLGNVARADRYLRERAVAEPDVSRPERK